MFLALKEMRKEKGRFVLIISIVVLISYLVFFLMGLANGLATDNRTAIDHWNAESIALKEGTNANILSSLIDVEDLEAFDGINFSPINIGRSVGYINGSETKANTIDIVLMGLHQDSEAYPEVIEGTLPETTEEVLVSISMHEEDGVDIGDILKLAMNDREFRVTGFTEDSKFNVSPVMYTDLEMASAASMIFIEEPAEGEEGGIPEPNDTDPIDGELDEANGESSDGESGATPGAPERVSGVIIHDAGTFDVGDEFEVISKGTFINELPGYLAQVLTFGLMIIFLILISSIVLGVFMFIITMQKQQTFGIMKVQGISNGYIAKSVILQTLLVCLIGVAIGLGLTYLSDLFLPATVPFRSNILFYGVVGILIVLFSLLGAIFSVRGVSKVDPLEVLE